MKKNIGFSNTQLLIVKTRTKQGDILYQLKELDKPKSE